MDDLKLQLLAAQAAGLEIHRGKGHQADMLFRQVEDGRGIVTGVEWSPLKDDGDALRLAVALEIDVLQRRSDPEVWAQAPMRPTICKPIGNDRTAATRRAIVSAAASIGAHSNGKGGE